MLGVELFFEETGTRFRSSFRTPIERTLRLRRLLPSTTYNSKRRWDPRADQPEAHGLETTPRKKQKTQKLENSTFCSATILCEKPRPPNASL